MRGKQAIVIGAGLAGLMGARVAADHYDRVTVLEKDDLPGTEPRKGVPQGNHIHVLWTAGSALLEQQFPGLFDALAADGGEGFDNSADMRWFHGGVWKMREHVGLRIYSQSRPLLEHHVRRKLLQHANVAIERGRVTGIRSEGGRIIGLIGQDASGRETEMDADVVIDASGRASRMPAWLESAGYSKPDVQQLDVDLGYSSRIYERRDGQDWKCMAVYARPPASRRSGVIFPIERNRWIVTLAGCFGDHPPREEAGFLDFARSLDRPDLHDAIAAARPVSDISSFRFKTESWRRYDRLDDLPDGLVMIGDALCSFNPLYGQGVTVAALEAAALAACLQGNRSLRDYYRETAGIIRYPWMLATGNDALYPEASKVRPWWAAPLGRYTDRVLRLSETHAGAHAGLLRVLHLAKTPLHLLRPDILTAVLLSPRANARPD